MSDESRAELLRELLAAQTKRNDYVGDLRPAAVAIMTVFLGYGREHPGDRKPLADVAANVAPDLFAGGPIRAVAELVGIARICLLRAADATGVPPAELWRSIVLEDLTPGAEAPSA